MSAALAWRGWLLDPAPASRRQARLGRWYRAWLAFRRNGLAMTGLVVVLALVLMAVAAPLLADPRVGDAAGARPSGCSRLPLRIGSAPMSSAATFSRASCSARAPRLIIVALVSAIVVPVGPGDRAARGLFRRLDRRCADARHRHLPVFPAPRAGAGLRRGAGPGHRERGHRHRADDLAALRAPRARRDADAPSAPSSSRRPSCRAPRILRIILTQIVPLCLPSVIIRLTLDMAGIILTAAGLGFLGLAAQPPAPEWGAMVSSGRQVLLDQWWVSTIPGIAIFVTSVGFNLLGRRFARRGGFPFVMSDTPLLTVRNLRVIYPGDEGDVVAVRNVSFDAGTRAAGHRRRIRLGQIDHRAGDHGPGRDARAGRGR